MTKDGLREKRELERLERVGGLRREDEGSRLGRLLGERVERHDNARVVVNKSAIEVSKAEEGLHVLDGCGCRPSGDGLELAGMHLDAVGAEQVAQVLHLGLVKRALARVGE